MITIYCQCGEKYLADEQHIGGKLQCRKCQRILSIEKSESSPAVHSAVQKDEHRPASQPKSQTVFAPSDSPSHHKIIIFGMAVLTLLVLVLVVFTLNKQSSSPRVPAVQKPTGVQSYSNQSSDSPTASTAKSSLPKKSEERPIAQSRREVEPENPNVLPLGTAPFGYDVRDGNSTLTVDNGTNTDALVRVIRIKHEKIRDFGIPAGNKFVADSIPPGNYVLRVAFGRDWNPKERRFNFRRSFSETQVFNVTESEWNEPTEDGHIVHTRATEMSITLHKVPHGNFKTHPISEEEFWQ
jgi:hypothetical protein